MASRQHAPLKVSSVATESDSKSLDPSGSLKGLSMRGHTRSASGAVSGGGGVSKPENPAAVAAGSGFYSSTIAMPSAAGHVRTSDVSAQNRPSTGSVYSLSSPAGPQLRATRNSRTSSNVNTGKKAQGMDQQGDFGLDRLDGKVGVSRPSMDTFARTSTSSRADVDSHAVARAVAVTRSLPRELSDCARHLSAFSADCLLPAQVRLVLPPYQLPGVWSCAASPPASTLIGL